MLKILVVDDEDAVLKIISKVLKTAGHNVEEAVNGAEGIRKFNEYDFDVVVTDLFMPLCNGDELAKHVRNAGKDIPIIAITGTPDKIDKSCFDIVLKKPFSLKTLTGCIKALEGDGKLH
jgi:CheY-like chemotaxis protein